MSHIPFFLDQRNITNIDYRFKPKLGMALIWRNLNDNSEPNINTLHAVSQSDKC